MFLSNPYTFDFSSLIFSIPMNPLAIWKIYTYSGAWKDVKNFPFLVAMISIPSSNSTQLSISAAVKNLNDTKEMQ